MLVARPSLCRCGMRAGLSNIHTSKWRQSRAFTSTRSTPTNFDAPFTTISESGLSDSQLEVRQAIQAIANKFDLHYWLERDQSGTYPHELYDELQKAGFIGIALPTEFGGAGLGISEGEKDSFEESCTTQSQK